MSLIALRRSDSSCRRFCVPLLFMLVAHIGIDLPVLIEIHLLSTAPVLPGVAVMYCIQVQLAYHASTSV